MLSKKHLCNVPGIYKKMNRHNSENVLAAFDTLLEEIEVGLRDINKAGANGFSAQDYDMAHRALEFARSVTVFHEKVSLLKGEWQELDADFQAERPKGTGKAVVVNPSTNKRSLPARHNMPALPEIPAPLNG